MDVKEIAYDVMEWIDNSGQGSLTRSCNSGNEASGFLTCGKVPASVV
jgi:hypothetical protein